MTTLREAAQQALEALCRCTPEQRAAITALRAALPCTYKCEAWPECACAALAQQEPGAWTDRELELIDGMIEVQLRHAAQCDAIANRPMAERQKGWDMERVALLHKIKSISPRHEWQGLTEEEREQATGWSVEHIEAALKEKNNA
jgi:hypothetical protein